MPTKKPPPVYDSALARQERRLEAFRLIGELVAEDREFASELQIILSAMLSCKGPTRSRSTGKTTIFERIKEFFIAKENEWQTAPEIMKGTGLSRGAVSHTLYKGHTELFQRKNHPTDGKMKIWRFKLDVWRKEVAA